MDRLRSIRIGAVAAFAAAAVLLAAAPAAAQGTARANIRGSGLLYGVDVTNTGTTTIRCLAFVATSGVEVVTAGGDGREQVQPSGFTAQGFELAPGQTASWAFTTRQRYPENGGGRLFVSSDCTTDSPPIIVTGPAPRPAASTMTVERVSGRPLVRPRGARRFARLFEERILQFGSTLDAREGAIRMTVTDESGFRRRARVSGGRATVRRRINGDDFFFEVLLDDPLEPRAVIAATRRRTMLISTDGGRFATRGRYATAGAGQAARWRITDRPRSTTVNVQRGRVTVVSSAGERVTVQAPRRVVVRAR